MKKVIINENQKGFLFKNGKFIKLLNAGSYHIFGGKKIETVNITEPLSSSKCTLETLLADEKIAKETTAVTVGDEQIALHFVDGKFSYALKGGKYAFWNTVSEHSFMMIDISSPYVDESVPEYIFSKLPHSYYEKTEVKEGFKARLYFNNKFERLLDAGTYYFWKNAVNISTDIIDTRLVQMNVTGQEIMTLDKVSLRINFVCGYKVTDYEKTVTQIDSFEEQLHVAVQLALREYIGKYKLDEILENKEKISEFVLARLKAKENELFVEIREAGVKDIILPGEIRAIMNTVLIAEKKAQANVIARREEVASTRSLLNTAKLMEENKTLYKLKELEYIERICENVGNINIGSGGDILTQLTNILEKSIA